MVTADLNEELAEIFTDYLNASESAIVNAKRQLAELFGVTESKSPAAVNEATFDILKFEPQKGAKIGDYEVAYAPNNLAEKWTQAFNVLKNANATINDRYHGQGYAYAYWLYGDGKIYRQKLKR